MLNPIIEDALKPFAPKDKPLQRWSINWDVGKSEKEDDGLFCMWKDVAELIRLIKEADNIISVHAFDIVCDCHVNWRESCRKAGIDI